MSKRLTGSFGPYHLQDCNNELIRYNYLGLLSIEIRNGPAKKARSQYRRDTFGASSAWHWLHRRFWSAHAQGPNTTFSAASSPYGPKGMHYRNGVPPLPALWSVAGRQCNPTSSCVALDFRIDGFRQDQ